MFKTLLLFLFLLFSTSILWAQAASDFDGVDDKATVYHHTDFNLSTKDFTIEAIVRDVAIDKAMLTVISKRDLSTNGFAIMINTIDGMKVIAEIGKDKYEIKTSVFEDKGCHSIGLRRSESEITLFIDDKAYSLGSNTKDINTTENLIIGDDGSNTHNPFNGYIEEVRFWDIARTDNQIFDWNHKCIAPSTSGLLALWNIEETSGQFFHDVASIKHHAYLGSGFSSDNQDPLWTSNKCLETCCDAHAEFLVSDYAPLAAQWVNFTNNSTNATAYEWSIDNQVVGTNQHLQHSFGMGVFMVRLKVTSQGGCTSYYSEVIEVTDNNFSYCGKESFTSVAVQALEDWENLDPNPNPNPYPQIKMYDRFGNRYLPNDITIPSQQIRSSGTTNWSCSCGIFELYFDDMFHNRDYGFDDPVLGTDRRAVACRVFEDLSALVNPSGTLPSNLVKIQMKKSEGKAVQETTAVDVLDPGVLAVAGPYLIAGYSTGVIDGLAYKTIVSGTNAIANTPGWNPNSYHGSVRVDFELPNFFLNNNNWTASIPTNQMDLYSTLLHESLHILGFFSLIDAEYNTNLSKINGTQLYNRFDTYLENTVGTPYINPITGILNPASAFTGGANCAADVKFNGTSNTNQDIYLPAPWNFSTLSHFNCTASNNNGCAINNGYVMNACIAPGEMQRAPNQAEYSTLCDIGYQLGTTYGNPAIGNPANNVPHQTYTSCSPTCAVAGIDDNLTTTISVAAGSSVTINSIDFLTNDNNTGGSYNLNTLLSSFGTISNITPSSFDFTPNPSHAGDAIIQYHPTCSNGNNGASALIFITVTPIVIPCNLPISSCNLLCNGDLEQTIYNNGWGTHNNIANFQSFYLDPNLNVMHHNLSHSSDLYDYDNSGNLISFNNLWLPGIYNRFANCDPGYGASTGGLPLPVGFNNGKRKYIGLWVGYHSGETFNLSLKESLIPSSSSIDNYRLGFWAYTTCDDIDIRMVLSEDLPCQGSGTTPYSNLYITSGFIPAGVTTPPIWASYPICPSYTALFNEGITPATTFSMGAPVNSTDGWEYFTMDFHVSDPNLDEVIFCTSTNNGSISGYILMDEITIEPIVPQLTITPTIIGPPCPGNKIIIEYNICSDIPVSGVNLEAQLPISSGLLYTNTLDFTNGQITGLDLGIGGNSLCTLVQVEIEIPVGASVPSTQSIFMDVTGGTACTSTSSNLTTDLNIGTGSPLAISVTPSVTGNVSIGSNFTVDVVISNTGTMDVQNVVVELPSGPHSVGLTYALTSTTIPNIPAGGQHTISTVPVSVSGPCGDAQVCAEVVSAVGACNLPGACSSLLTVTGTNTINFPIEIESGYGTSEIPTAMTIGDDGSIYVTGFYNFNINFVDNNSTYTLTHTASCLSIFVAKFSSCGFEWAKEIPACAATTSNLQFVPKIEVSSTGNLYVGFNFSGSFNVNNTNYNSTGGYDLGIIKLDNANGNILSTYTDGGIEDDYLIDIALSINNPTQIVIAAQLNGTTGNSSNIAGQAIPYHSYIPIAPSILNAYGTSVVASYLDNGSITPQWAKYIASPVNSPSIATPNFTPTVPSKLAIDNNGNIFLAGVTYEHFNFNGLPANTSNAGGNPGVFSSNNGDVDAFIVSYSSTGNETWAKLYGSNTSSSGLFAPEVQSLDLIENNNNLYLNFSSNELDNKVIKLSTADGSYVWNTPISLANTTSTFNTPIRQGFPIYSTSLGIDNNGDVLISGSFYLADPNDIFNASYKVFSSINFHGTLINYTDMADYNTSTFTNDLHTGWFVEKLNGNTGAFEWVLPNTSITGTVDRDLMRVIPNTIAVAPNNDIYNYLLLRGGQMTLGNTSYSALLGSQDLDGYIVRIQDQGTGGVYARQATNGNTISNQNAISTLSDNTIESTTSNISTKLYPNPTTGKVTLEIKSDLENNVVEQIIIYDVTGRKVQEISTEQPQTTYDINLNSQQSGVYFVEMIINQQLIIKRVVLMK